MSLPSDRRTVNIVRADGCGFHDAERTCLVMLGKTIALDGSDSDIILTIVSLHAVQWGKE